MYSVLYVDDEQALLEVGKLFLEGDGQFAVDTITSAPAALELMQEKNYDAVISDYQMPGMDGIVFLKKVRGDKNPVPFILFTGRGREEIVIQALNEGADFYLQKGGDPVPQFAELAHKIRTAVEQRRAEGSIRDLERREQEIINFLPDATFAIDLHGTVIAWNRAIEELTGIPADEMLGKGDFEYALPFYGERRPILIDLIFSKNEEIRQRYQDLAHDGTTIAAETSLPRVRGEPRTLWVKATPLYDRRGKVTGAIEAIRDITARKAAETELRKARDLLEERVRDRTADLYAANLQLQKEIDGRKIIEAALQESEARYRTIVEQDYQSILANMEDVFYRTDAEGRLVMVSPSGLRLFGNGSMSEVIGRPVADFYADPAARDAVVAAIRREGKVVNREVALRRRDGSVVPVAVNSRVRTGPQGEFAGVEGIFRDISGLKTVRQQLAESEEQYRVLVGHIQDGAFLMQDGIVIYCNEAFAGMIGYDVPELLGGPIPRLIAPEDREMVMERQRARLEGKTLGESYEFRMLHKDGTTRIPVLLYVGIGSYRGRPAVIGTVRDMRKERERERALVESEGKYRALVESSFDGILIHQDGVITYANATAVRLFGAADAGGITGRTVLACVHPDYREIVTRRMNAATGEEQPVITEKFLRLDGTAFTVEAAAKPFVWEGRPAVHVVFRDITDRLRNEEALRQANRKLTLLSSVTRHDIINHLLVLKGYVALSKDCSASPRFQDLQQRELALMARIEEEILFTREYQEIGAQAPVWQNTEACLRTAVEHVAMEGIMLGTGGLAGIEIYADPMLPKVFFNLVENAIRHGGEKVKNIRFSVQAEDGGLAICCDDDGPGVEAAEKTLIFGRGYGKHTGLGLFLIREILAITGITIRENGEPGCGARFVITVPAQAWRHAGSPAAG